MPAAQALFFCIFLPNFRSASPNKNYKNSFIGFGNPQLSKEFGLPSLTSAEDEMIQLALFLESPKIMCISNKRLQKRFFD